MLVKSDLTLTLTISFNNYFLFKGICVGNSKPDLGIFLKPIVSEMKRIERGISLEFRKENELVIKPVKFFLIAGIFDKPAKSSILNMMSYNGFGGCTKCLQLGETYKTQNGISH